MADQQYGISEEQKRILLEKHARRLELRKEFQKQITNPHGQGEGGCVFDEQLQRHQAMRINRFRFFKPTYTTIRNGLLLIIPYTVFTYIMKKRRDKKEHMLRTGQISYADRQHKFI